MCSGLTSANDRGWKLIRVTFVSRFFQSILDRENSLLVGNVFAIWSVRDQHRPSYRAVFRSVHIATYEAGFVLQLDRRILLEYIGERRLINRGNVFAYLVWHLDDNSDDDAVMCHRVLARNDLYDSLRLTFSPSDNCFGKLLTRCL